MKTTLSEKVDIPEKVTVTVVDGLLTVKGEKGEVQRNFYDPQIQITVKDNKVHLDSKDATRREKKRLYTYRAHLRNMLRGVNTPHVYKVKVCSGHFPMNVAIKDNKLSVKNFLGEKLPRLLPLQEGVDVKFADGILTVTSCSKEKAGQVAASMEQLTRITNRDRRIFQDGLYIIEKDGKAI